MKIITTLFIISNNFTFLIDNYLTMVYSAEDIKICVYTICKNEETFAERWLLSAQEADAIFVNDTGSTDKTIDILKSHPKVTLIEGNVRGENFRFDKAWNEVLDIIPDTYDFCVRLDMDMMLTCGWCDRLKKYIVGLIEKEKYNLSSQALAFGVYQVEIRYGSDTVTGGSRWSCLIHENIKGGRYFGAVHEKYSFFGFFDYTGETIPTYVLTAIHTEKANQSDKAKFYSQLAEKNFKEFPTYLNYLIVFGCSGGVRNDKYLSKIDDLLNNVSEEDNIVLSRMEQGIRVSMNDIASRVVILYLNFLIKKFLDNNDSESKKIMSEIKSLKTSVKPSMTYGYFKYCIMDIQHHIFSKNKNKEVFNIFEEIGKRTGIELYNYFIKTFDK